MNPLSIFSSETLQLRSLKGAFATLAFCVGIYLVLDVAIRTWDPVLHGGWQNPGLQHKVETARDLAAKHGEIDVLLISVSIGLQIDVSRWTHATGGKLVCYNAGMYAQRPPLARLMFENIYFPECKPKKVIYSLCPYDLNSYGATGDTARYQGEFWDSIEVRKMTANSLWDRTKLAFDSSLYTIAARHRLRRLVQKGPVVPDLVFMENGVMFPTLGKANPEPPGPAQRYAEDNPNRNFSIPADGAPEDLMKLAKFCRDNGVEFVLVNHPVTPYSRLLLTNPEKDYALYLNVLDSFRKEGFQVLDASADLNLPNTSFPDPLHLNRWGAYLTTNYFYEKLILKWYPELCKIESLARPAEIPIYKSIPRNMLGATYRHWSQNPKEMYATPYQVMLEEGVRLNLNGEIPPGRYIFDLYSGDDLTSAPPNVDPHIVAYECQNSNGTYKKVEVPLSTRATHGSRMVRTKIDFPTTTTINIVAHEVSKGSKGMLLDTLFIYPEREATWGAFNPDALEAKALALDPKPLPN